MTSDQIKTMHTFEARVRQLMQAYEMLNRNVAALKVENAELKANLARHKAQVEMLEHNYAVLKTVRMLEISDQDVKATRQKFTQLIKDIDKRLALLDV